MPARRREQHGATSYPRIARVNQVLREVVADEVERLADVDDRLRLLTVTGVDTSADLRHATVYLASLPPPAVEALAAQRLHLQRAVGRQVRMKRTPQLDFASDPAVEGGDRIEAILRHLHDDHHDDGRSADAVPGGDAARGSAAGDVPGGDVPGGDVPGGDVPGGDVPSGGADWQGRR